MSESHETAVGKILLTDTHAHYDDHAFDADREEILSRKLPEAGIGRVVDIAAAFPSLEETVRLAEKYDYVYASLGLHPSDVWEILDRLETGREAELMTDTQFERWQEFQGLSEKRRRESEAVLAGEAEGSEKGLMFHGYLFQGRERDLLDHVLMILLTNAQHPKVVAIGEIGLDYHWHQEDLPRQKAWFAAQILAAKALSLPVVIHSRDAAQDTLELLEGYYPKRLEADRIKTECPDADRAFDPVCGVMHCYSYKWEMALDYVKMGFLIGIGGSSTYGRAKHKKGKLYQVIREVPLESMVLETDAPYQTPESHRGERNDSSLLYEVAEYIAEIKGCTTEEVVAVTRDNAFRLYPKMK